MIKTTLKEIAEALNISVSTVSKALKDYPDVSSKTKQRVLEMARSVKYSPNSFAQSLRSNKSHIIGIIVPAIVHEFFSNIIQAVVETAKKNGYLVIVLESDESNELEKKQIDILIEKNVDGILISLSDNTVNFNHIKSAMELGVPIVLYDKISRILNCSRVIIDDHNAAKIATEHLIKTGCTKIAHIRGPLKPQTTIDRMKGYKDALLKNNIAYDKSLVYESANLSFEDGYELTNSILKDHPDLDAIFSFTDMVAVGVLTRLNELNIKVPEQVSVIGFSNWFLSQVTHPSLTTIDQSGHDIGYHAFNLLLDELDGNVKESEKKTVTVPTQLIVRRSTRPIS
ncbi:MAG: LacI family DNA-binding transcriptional regulator [Bacteroidota bacterium]